MKEENKSLWINRSKLAIVGIIAGYCAVNSQSLSADSQPLADGAQQVSTDHKEPNNAEKTSDQAKTIAPTEKAPTVTAAEAKAVDQQQPTASTTKDAIASDKSVVATDKPVPADAQPATASEKATGEAPLVTAPAAVPEVTPAATKPAARPAESAADARSPYASKNQVQSTASWSCQTQNGNLTVNSWYIPRMIRDTQAASGWRVSHAGDWRPVLMAFSPDHDTQVRYLAYMDQNNFLTKANPTIKIDFKQASATELTGYMINVQDNCERLVAQTRTTDRLRTLFDNFVMSDPKWRQNVRQDGGVLRDEASHEAYHMAQGDQAAFLPHQLTGDAVLTGWHYDTDQQAHYYYSSGGQQAKNTVLRLADGHYYGFDADGKQLVDGLATVNGQHYFFGVTGQATCDSIVTLPSGAAYYFGRAGAALTSSWLTADGQHAFPKSKGVSSRLSAGHAGVLYAEASGQLAVGPRTIAGKRYNFGTDYKLITGWANDGDGAGYHYYRDNGVLAVNQFVANTDGSWSYVDEQGNRVVGPRVIGGKHLNFGTDYKQIKGIWAQDDTGYHYYSAGDGARVTNATVPSDHSTWVTVDHNGDPI